MKTKTDDLEITEKDSFWAMFKRFHKAAKCYLPSSKDFFKKRCLISPYKVKTDTDR